MSDFSESRRNQVRDRAGHRCEYCHLPTRGQVATFPIDHILPKSLDGSNSPDNLALACPHCNAMKAAQVEGIDPLTTLVTTMFNPRRDSWDEHFALTGSGILSGVTPTGRATIEMLHMNDADMVELRLLLGELGLFEEVRTGAAQNP